MYKRIVAGFLGSLLACSVSTSTLACGESLYRVGKGVAFRDYSAPLPGRILALVTTESDREMASILSEAGHDVHQVASVDQLGAELSQVDHDFDVIITMYEDHAAVQEEITRAKSTASYLPVAVAESDQLDQARMINRDALSSDDRINTFLRAIHYSIVQQTPS